jgi:hypothetical protein
MQYVAPVSIIASKCCSLVRVPRVTLRTNAILLAATGSNDASPGTGERGTS